VEHISTSGIRVHSLTYFTSSRWHNVGASKLLKASFRLSMKISLRRFVLVLLLHHRSSVSRPEAVSATQRAYLKRTRSTRTLRHKTQLDLALYGTGETARSTTVRRGTLPVCRGRLGNLQVCRGRHGLCQCKRLTRPLLVYKRDTAFASVQRHGLCQCKTTQYLGLAKSYTAKLASYS